MKKIFLLLLFFWSVVSISQVVIGKTNATNNSVSLEFGDGNKGMVLPWVTSVAVVSGAVDGTMVYDLSDHKVKFKKSGNWFDLSVDSTGTANTSQQDILTENTSAKTVIGLNPSDVTPGILVLSDSDKAMILPKGRKSSY